MLAQCDVIGFIPTKDAARARNFYEQTLGLRFLSDDLFAIVMESNGTMIRIAQVKDYTPVPFTILGWKVENIEEEVATLAERGVSFKRYPWLEQTESGVWIAPGGAKVAWFQDPDGNVLSLSQHP
ncbi:MAG TPA: VOC family protein [Silvibacterium sp.]|jgi:catechol 2,3-dioxygenase-like lactoylglutathione lyase family enzyme|nr:VOC family protein [Silvibacterium sp.]